MPDQLMEAGLRSAQDTLERALRTAPQRGDATADVIARFGLLLAIEAIERVRANLDDDLDDEWAVYSVVAACVAQDLRLPEPVVLRAVVDLCGVVGHEKLIALLPPADAAVIKAVGDWLLRVTVHYSMPKAGPVNRTVHLYFGADERGVKSRELRDVISRDVVPDDIRERAIRDGLQETTFQIFPRRA